ncbi:MAG: tripartite tricarboxylate transporter substrate binding protein [Oscillospiraceae bacterium]|nr:tripartite tricarboxylate transporter substrate binding protein [Oscillospiraceae bacterium]
MKKYMAIVLALVMVLSLTACGGSGSNASSGGNESAPAAAPADSGSTQSAPSNTETAPVEAPKTDYPTKPVEVVYHSSVGSGGDIMIRAFDQSLTNLAKAGVINHKGWTVNNMPGGSGAIAWTYTADAEPDGYTLLGVSSTILTSPLMNQMDVNYESFEPIAILLIDPMVIAVPGSSPYNTFEELVEAAKAAPGTQSWAGGVAGELGFVAGMQVEKSFGIDINLVPFEGGGDAAASLMGGHLDAAIGEFAELSEAAAAGSIKILAAFNPLTVEGYTDTPTMADLGHDDIKVTKIRGILGPKGIPEDVLEVIRGQLKAMLDEESFKEYVAANGLIVEWHEGEDAMNLMAAQTEMLKASLAEVGG